jgi:long-subunit fatty acid transport protein
MSRFLRWTLPTLTLLAPAIAYAQTNERIYEALDFRFATPGARAVGMGVTFVGLADDATAASSNPAGLSNLQTPELSFETIRLSTSQTYVVTSRYPPPCDGPCQTLADFGHTGWTVPSFASFAMPVGRSFTIAMFSNSEQDVRQGFALSPRSFGPIDTAIGQLPPFGQTAESGHISVSVRNYGVSGAWVARRWLSAGASLVVTHMNLESLGLNSPGSQTPGAPPCPHNPVRSETDTNASVTRPSGFAGLLVKPRPWFSAGFAYYGGATFAMQTLVCGTFATATVINGAHPNNNVRTDYVVPDRVSIGVAVKPWRLFTALADMSRVNYSSMLTDNFRIVDFGYDGSGLSKNNYHYDDVNEFHGGVEFRMLVFGSHMLALRAGAFTSPSHSLRFTPNALIGDDTAEYYQFNVHVPSDTKIGRTAGVGLTFGNRLQVDAAYSRMIGANTFVISFVRRLL